MRMTLEQVSNALGAVGSLGESGGVIPGGVQIDSRCVREGELFFCIRGERFDGHTFAATALKKGACGVVAERLPFSMDDMARLGDVPFLMVSDTVAALGRLALHHRLAASATVVGITGTAGKTTVKELLAHTLAVRGATAKNYLNKNNQIGLPLSMLGASGQERFWVLEVGISQAHDMDELGGMLRPDLALILNVGPGHLEGLGDKGVACHKAQLCKHVASGGLALVSADYPDLVAEARKVCRELRYFSTRDASVPYFARYMGAEREGSGRYSVRLDTREFEVVVPFCGAYAAENVIAVAAAAHLLGLTSKEIMEGLQTATQLKQRFSRRCAGPWVVIDDTYNANPLSAGRMLEAAAESAGKEPLVLVMGEMLELGPAAGQVHVELGRSMGAAKPAAVFWKGGYVNEVQQGLAGAAWNGQFFSVEDAAAFMHAFARIQVPGGLILFKGSRGNALEIFVKTFCDAVQHGRG